MRSSQPHWVFKPFAKDPPNDKSPALGNSRAGLFAGILRVGRLTLLKLLAAEKAKDRQPAPERQTKARPR
jgi:hypothetical protein